jgi:hypothetical protein
MLQSLFSTESCAIELESKISVKVGKSPNSLAAVDLDNDGSNEIIVSSQTQGTVRILRNILSEKKRASLDINAGPNPTEIRISDMNNDNYLDIVIANHETSNFRVLLNDKKGFLNDPKAVVYQIEASPHIHTLGIGDFNRDRINDVVIDSWENSEVSIYYLDSKGGYSRTHSVIPVKEQPRTNLVVANLDGDALPDIITPATRLGGVSIILGNDLSSAKLLKTDTAPFFVAVADVNLDGNQDIITVHRNGNFNLSENEGVTLLLGNGKGQFTIDSDFPRKISGAPSSVSVGDINGDRWPEIVTANYRNNSITVIYREGSTDVYKQKSFSVGSRPESVVVADIDSDGLSEVIVANRESDNISVLKFYSNNQKK